MKSEREMQLEETLRTLIEEHFFSSHLEWSHVEGVTLEDVSPSLHNDIKNLFPELDLFDGLDK